MDNQAKNSCHTLLEDFRKTKHEVLVEKLVFKGVGERDVYNITAPFKDEEKTIIAGRVEERTSEQSEVYFFYQDNDQWVPDRELGTYTLQDPFITFIHDELIFGGVEISPHPEDNTKLMWRTIFYRGKSIKGLTKFFEGPIGMKDLRLVELPDQSIGVFTRPQGDKGGRGKIGYAQVKQLSDLTVEVIDQAPLIEGQFAEGEWGGANEIHVLDSNHLGVLGHIACFDAEGDRHYYPMVFSMNLITKATSEIHIIAERSLFLPGEAKRPDLNDVVFSGGIVRQTNQQAVLYAGISDAEAQKMTLKDPFIQFD